MDKVQSVATFGFFRIDRIAFSDLYTYFYDVLILNTVEEDTDYLDSWANDPEYIDKVKCCWTGGQEIAQRITGFGRVIHYYDKLNEGKNPTTAF